MMLDNNEFIDHFQRRDYGAFTLTAPILSSFRNRAHYPGMLKWAIRKKNSF